MTEDTQPPTPLPPAAEPPYPPRPAPHAAAEKPPVAKKPAAPAPIGALGVTLIGGAVAATIGMLVALPFLKRRKATAAKPRRSPSRKSGR